MKHYTLILLSFLLFTTIACEKEEIEKEPEITINDFVGSWNSISTLMTNNANAGEEMEIIGLGAELRFTVLDGGATRTWFTFGTFSDEWDAQVTLNDNSSLTTTPAEAERGINVFEFVLNNDTLSLTNHDDSFDFSLTGEPDVSATSNSIFIRN